MTQTSKRLFFIAKEPIMQSTKMTGVSMPFGTLRTFVKSLMPAKPNMHISVFATNIPRNIE